MYTQEDADKEYKEFEEYIKAISDRIDHLPPFHEDNVTFLRIDVGAISQTFFGSSDLSKDHKFSSIVKTQTGLFMAACKRDHYDEFMQQKKEALKKYDIIMFNQEVAWSLNIPGMPEIWTISLQNITNIDTLYNVFDLKKRSLQKRVDLFSGRK